MNYDSSEEKNHQQSLAEKLKLIREFASDEKNMQDVDMLSEKIIPFIQSCLEKIQSGEQLDNEEQRLFDRSVAVAKKLTQGLGDMTTLLGHSIIVRADAYFFHIKALAEQGNKDAQKIYENLLPHYRASLLERTQSPEDKN